MSGYRTSLAASEAAYDMANRAAMVIMSVEGIVRGEPGHIEWWQHRLGLKTSRINLRGDRLRPMLILPRKGVNQGVIPWPL